MSTERGFTLLELVIASSLLALLGLGTALVLNSGLNSAEQLQKENQQLQQLDRAVLILQQDIATMLPRPNRASDSLNLSPDDRQALRGFGQPLPENGLLLEFVRPSPWATDQYSGLERVRYRLDQNQLLRDSTTIADPAPTARWQPRRLISSVEQVEMLFLSQQHWTDNWRASKPDQLPEAIMLRLKTPRRGTLTFVMTTGTLQ